MFREEVRALNEELNYRLLYIDFIRGYALQFKPKVLITLLHPRVFSKCTLCHTPWSCAVIMGFSFALSAAVFSYHEKKDHACIPNFEINLEIS